MVARELRSEQTIRLKEGEFPPVCPYDLGSDTLFVAYAADAELQCHLSLGWGIPQRILDLCVEFRRHLNPFKPKPDGKFTLLNCLSHHKCPSIDEQQKEKFHDLAIRGGPFTAEEMEGLLRYCETDIIALGNLFPKMAKHINWSRATYRGRYLAAVARMEHISLPIDVPLYRKVADRWDGIKAKLIQKIDVDYGVYRNGSFNFELFRAYLIRNKIAWPFTPKGRLDTRDKTFKDMANAYPQLSPLRELRHALSDLKMDEVVVSPDGRNRCGLRPYVTKTSRNAPAASKYIGGPSCWMRSLIKPPPGYAIAYLDYEQQEIAIAAALSGDLHMQTDYLSGDFYVGFGKRAGHIPPDGTKKTHEKERDTFKVTSLGINYDMRGPSLGRKINQPTVYANELLVLHHELYSVYWEWSERIMDRAVTKGVLQTVMGWKIRTPGVFNPRSIRNFMMQSHGAELLRLTCCLATEEGLSLCGPLHDAIFIESPISRIEEDVARLKAIMREASRIVLGGFECRVEDKIFEYPKRYRDKRGVKMWNVVMDLIEEPNEKLEEEGPAELGKRSGSGPDRDRGYYATRDLGTREKDERPVRLSVGGVPI
jgi:hypothetical protein